MKTLQRKTLRRRRPRPAVRIRNFAKPICPTHGCDMRVVSTPPDVRYFGCPVPGCRQSAVTARREEDWLEL